MKSRRTLRLIPCLLWILIHFWISPMSATESPFLYGIHDHDPDPISNLSHITNGTGTGAWVTATVAVGANTNDVTGVNFSALATAGNTIICRINFGYYPYATIPLPSKYY